MNILFIENLIEENYGVKEKIQALDTQITNIESCKGLHYAALTFDLKLYDAVIVDLGQDDGLPQTDLEQVSYFTKRLPVIFLMNHFGQDAAIKLLKLEAEECLVKHWLEKEQINRVLAHSIQRFQVKKNLRLMNEEQKQINQRLQQLAIMDPVTELLNLRGLNQTMMRELELFKRGESNILFLVIGLDAFKQINTRLGHRSGDIILKEVSERLKSLLRVSDYVARIGGDEFLVLLPHTRFAEGARVAEKIRLAISQSPVSVNSGDAVYITASLGLGTVTEDFILPGQLLSATHTLLYQSKAAGKNRITYEGCRNQESSDHLDVMYKTFQEPSSFRAVRQEIMNLTSETCAGYEMLSRSNIESFEMPDDFFKVSMENSSLSLVDFQCFKACIEASKDLPHHLKYHLNLFPSTLIDVPTRNLLNVIHEFTEHPSKYCVEISEQQIIGEPSYLFDAVSQLRKAGLSVAIDDVGFGRSCLESLVLLEPDIVKIDKKWVTGIKQKSSSQRSLSRFLKVTQALGAEVIAEGVETIEDLQVLQDMGVLYGQGYYFGKPV